MLGSWWKSQRDGLRLDQGGQRSSHCPIVLFGRRTWGDNNVHRAKFGRSLGNPLGLGRFCLDRFYLGLCFSHGTLASSLSGRTRHRVIRILARVSRRHQQTENSSDRALMIFELWAVPQSMSVPSTGLPRRASSKPHPTRERWRIVAVGHSLHQ